MIAEECNLSRTIFFHESPLTSSSRVHFSTSFMTLFRKCFCATYRVSLTLVEDKRCHLSCVWKDVHSILVLLKHNLLIHGIFRRKCNGKPFSSFNFALHLKINNMGGVF